MATIGVPCTWGWRLRSTTGAKYAGHHPQPGWNTAWNGNTWREGEGAGHRHRRAAGFRPRGADWPTSPRCYSGPETLRRTPDPATPVVCATRESATRRCSAPGVRGGTTHAAPA